jgi:hypothetical protein
MLFVLVLLLQAARLSLRSRAGIVNRLVVYSVEIHDVNDITALLKTIGNIRPSRV